MAALWIVIWAFLQTVKAGLLPPSGHENQAVHEFDSRVNGGNYTGMAFYDAPLVE